MENFNVYVIPVMVIMNMIIILSGHIAVRFCSGRKRLQKQGYPDEYIALSERINRSAGKDIIASLLIFQILGIAFSLMLGYNISIDFFLNRIFMASIIFMTLVLSVKYAKNTRAEQKRIVTERGDKVVIDFNYDALRLIMNWKMEIAAFALIVYFNIRLLDNNIVLYIYAVLPWYFYLMVKSLRYQILETIRYSYRLVGILMVTYQAAKLAMFFGYLSGQTGGDFKIIGTVNIALAALAGIIMLWTVVRGALNLPKIAKMFPKAARAVQKSEDRSEK